MNSKPKMEENDEKKICAIREQRVFRPVDRAKDASEEKAIILAKEIN